MEKFNIQKKIESFNKTIRLPENIIDAVETIANYHNVSFNKVVLEMIEFALENMEGLENNDKEPVANKK